MNRTPSSAAGQITITAVIGAMIVIVQTLIKAFFPMSFWTLVQDNTEFWASVQLLLTAIALHIPLIITRRAQDRADATQIIP